MKFPPEHYPPETMQRTWALLALNAIFYCLEDKDRPGDTEQLQKIDRWAEECAEQTSGPVLPVVRRRMDRAWAHAVGYIPLHGADRPYYWAVIFYAALTLVEDVRSSCPAYGRGPKRQAWRFLWQTSDNLVRRLLKTFPGLDEDGTRLYERISWALDDRQYWRAA